MGDAGCEAIVGSGILSRLKVLDLNHGCVTDVGARILASCPEIRALERLCLRRNAMSTRGVKELQSVVKNVEGSNQLSEIEIAQRRYLNENSDFDSEPELDLEL